MTRRHGQHAGPHQGFTLIELIAVLSLGAVLSLTALPAMHTVSNARHAGLARDVEHHLAWARDYAVNSGRAAGLDFDLDAQTLRLIEVHTEGQPPTDIPRPGHAPGAVTRISEHFPGAAVTHLELHAPNATTLWFDPQGVPHLRTPAGAHIDDLAQDAVISISGGHAVVVHSSTGLVER